MVSVKKTITLGMLKITIVMPKMIVLEYYDYLRG